MSQQFEFAAAATAAATAVEVVARWAALQTEESANFLLILLIQHIGEQTRLSLNRPSRCGSRLLLLDSHDNESGVTAGAAPKIGRPRWRRRWRRHRPFIFAKSTLVSAVNHSRARFLGNCNENQNNAQYNNNQLINQTTTFYKKSSMQKLWHTNNTTILLHLFFFISLNRK